MAGTGDAAWKVSAPGSREQQAVQFVLAGDTGGQSQPLRPQFPQVYNKNLFSKPPLMAPPPQHTHLHEDRALTGRLVLVSLLQGLPLNLLPVSFQFPVSSFGLQEGRRGISETLSLPAHFSLQKGL